MSCPMREEAESSPPRHAHEEGPRTLAETDCSFPKKVPLRMQIEDEWERTPARTDSGAVDTIMPTGAAGQLDPIETEPLGKGS